MDTSKVAVFTFQRRLFFKAIEDAGGATDIENILYVYQISTGLCQCVCMVAVRGR